MVRLKFSCLLGIVKSLACNVVLKTICGKLDEVVSLDRIIIGAK